MRPSTVGTVPSRQRRGLDRPCVSTWATRCLRASEQQSITSSPLCRTCAPCSLPGLRESSLPPKQLQGQGWFGWSGIHGRTGWFKFTPEMSGCFACCRGVPHGLQMGRNPSLGFTQSHLGMGQIHQGTGCSLWFPLPGFHFGTHF